MCPLFRLQPCPFHCSPPDSWKSRKSSHKLSTFICSEILGSRSTNQIDVDFMVTQWTFKIMSAMYSKTRLTAFSALVPWWRWGMAITAPPSPGGTWVSVSTRIRRVSASGNSSCRGHRNKWTKWTNLLRRRGAVLPLRLIGTKTPVHV